MTIIRLQFIKKYKDRHGKVRHYLRRRGFKQIPLPDPSDPSFFTTYQAALASTEEPKEKPKAGVGTFCALVDAWYESSAFRQLGPATQTNYRRILSRMQKEDYGAHAVTDFEPQYIRRFVARAADTPAAANHRLRLFRLLFRFAVEDGWIKTDPTLGVRRLKEKGEGAKSWSEDEIEKYEARWLSGSPQRLALALLLYTGQRRSDVVRMGWDDIESGFLRVRQAKTGAALLIPLHGALIAEIEQCDRSAPRFLLTREDDPRPYSPNGFYNRFVEWAKEAGLPAGLSPHGLRKAAARRLAEAGCTPHQIAAITGHKTLAEVERYTRAADQVRMAQEAMRRLGCV
ncbi:phage related integrase [Gluconacetobacter sacchari DSM 12717]|uniref:Phage related integrase n=1 Tax=Gluconacetobacter sacchari DSM 12717 TaxID=1307940 RepID=A0ABQ0P2M1_9PROT|nr:tyrosine-type recombinase/integrase [Gluconacetobacter sacchari]GBQ19403.1 phage related integrase [Gluconacetobacter sacchari DSM 12717]